MGKVVTGNGVTVGLALDQFRPTKGAPASDLVRDNQILSEVFFQSCLLDPGRDVRFSTGVETNDIGETFVGIVRRPDCTSSDHGKDGKKDNKTDGDFFHSFSPPGIGCWF